MKKQLITSSIILALATTPVMAADKNESGSTNELIGFGTGAIIGGIIAGPVGSVVAGTIGVIIGDSLERKQQMEVAEQKIAQHKLALMEINNEKARLVSKLSVSEQEHKLLTDKLALHESTLNHAEQLEQIKLNLRFEVDSSKVESFYKPQIKHLAMMMQENPELSVNLSGFADPSGSAERNMKLSQARTESVKAMLIDYGVSETNILTQAFGESKLADNSRSISNDFNNRRVDVEILSPTEPVSTVAQTMEESSIKDNINSNNDLASALTDINHISDKQALVSPKQDHVLADIN